MATEGAGGRFGAAVRLAPSGAARGVVTEPDGATTVLWGALTDPEAQTLDRLFASTAPPAPARFAAAEAVSDPAEPAANSAALALDPRGGQPAALWIGAREATAGEPLGGDFARRPSLRHARPLTGRAARYMSMPPLTATIAPLM